MSNFGLITFAAAIFIGKSFWDILFGWMNRHEKEAVEEEYRNTESEERKRELTFRYPQYLIPPVNYAYYRAARKQLEQEQPVLRIKRKLLDLSGGTVALFLVAGLPLYLIWKVLAYFSK
jgi:hypothetical protein